MKTTSYKLIILFLLSFGGHCQSNSDFDKHTQVYRNAQRGDRLQNKQQQKVKLKSISDEKFGYQLIKKRRITKIPFEFQANLIIVPVKINNSDTLRFILDTGVSSILLTDPDVAQKLAMKSVRKVKIAGAGEGDEIEAGIVIDNTIRIGEVIGYRQNLVVLQDDKLKLSEFVGLPVHGIIGYDIFNRFAVTIDFAMSEITLQNPEHYKYKPSKGERFPITIEENKPYLSVMELMKENQSTPIKVILDTGAGHAISLETNGKHLPEKVLRAQLGRGLNGIINGSLGRIPLLKVGKFEMKNLVASFPDSNSFRLRSTALADRQGSVGCEFLRRFKVTFNYRDQYMVLKPINRRMKEPFEHNMTGIELMAKGEDYHEFMIDKVIHDSPADDAGLQEGDRVMFINNKSSKDITISEIYKLFQRGEGKNLNLVVKRGNGLVIATVNLRRLI
jgi:predicted aspartyl protease